MLPPFDPITGRLPPGEHEAAWDEVVDRFGSGLVFADFFQNDRETGRKGIVVIDLTVGGWA